MVVVVVRLAVVVEPGLHALREVLILVGRGVLALPQPLGGGLLEGRLPAGVEGLVHPHHPAQVDVVGELVDQDVLGRVGIAGIGQHVFLSAATDRIGP